MNHVLVDCALELCFVQAALNRCFELTNKFLWLQYSCHLLLVLSSELASLLSVAFDHQLTDALEREILSFTNKAFVLVMLFV